MISALYAKKQTDKVVEHNKYIELEKTFDEIEHAINKGMYFITITNVISNETIDKLVELDYKVRDCSKDGYYKLLISWDEVEES